MAGIADASMSRDDAWRFLVLGRSLERADTTARLVPRRRSPAERARGRRWWRPVRCPTSPRRRRPRPPWTGMCCATPPSSTPSTTSSPRRRGPTRSRRSSTWPGTPPVADSPIPPPARCASASGAS
ncbi:MAG: alpha-E domain-containing protein [Kineosporiaceae bacterium]